ncbi:ABC transporter ATP-binding protein [Candidatus Falkowbacteria bacterium]|nr:ABC transporter ATP-binding protein [Candidatus Falkowbacteria bacterium]
MSDHYQQGKHVLYAENVIKVYGAKIVLADIDLAVSRGEFVTMVGPSGCGKSTLLRLILGQEQQSSGTLIIDGEAIEHPDERRGVVYQKYSLFPHLTVFDNVRLGPQFTRNPWRRFVERKIVRDEAMKFIDKVGLTEHASKFPAQLSGGQQQRVAIAQALIMRPAVLLMDEPYGALDPFTREELQEFLLQLWEETKMTIFFVTHDLEEALYLGSRLIGISQFYFEGKDMKARARGARVVVDLDLGRGRKTPATKATREFGESVRFVRHECFTPGISMRVIDLPLRHPDSFITLDAEQRGEK